MRIIKGVEAIPVDHPVFLIFGQPGIGKSSLGYSCKDALCLDFDKGAHRAANRTDTLVIDTWNDVIELMNNREALEPYASLVVDTVGRCLDVMTAHMAATQPKLAPGGNPSLQGWGKLRNDFRTWIAALRALGKDVVLIAHDKEDKDGDSRVVRPDISGGSYGEVFKVSDFCGYYYMAGKNRILDFNPTDRWVGKNPAGWEPIAVPAIGKSATFMGELIEQGRASLGQISEESASVLRQVETWREKIAALQTPEQFTEQGPLIGALSPILKPQVWKILEDTSKARGFTFDRQKKAFLAPVAQAV